MFIFAKLQYMAHIPYRKVLVTGGAGFIGSNFLNYIVNSNPHCVFINIDILNYCSDINNIHPNVHASKNYIFEQLDLKNKASIDDLLTKHPDIDTIVHFAAQSHVDTSFVNSTAFIADNIVATHNLLQSIVDTQKTITLKKFIYVSTDEVYGETGDTVKTETSVLNPTNPYAASKASAEMLCTSYMHSFKLPVIITRSNNVYGRNQYIEKLIPKFANQLLNGEKCSIHGCGSYKRTFLHALDVCRAFVCIINKGTIGEVYNIGSNDEFSVLQIAHYLVQNIKKVDNLFENIEFVQDRVFNDSRYLINSRKLECLGWKPLVNITDGMEDTIQYYITRYKNIKQG